MFTIRGRKHSLCSGVNRREFLRVGALGMAGLTLADLLRHEATAGSTSSRPKSVIYIVLGGGPSHIDMWDLKPKAPLEYRGPFTPIATRLPGAEICEHMPLQAGMMDQLALIRGIRSVENDHFLSEVYTGLPRTSGKRPAFGSIVSRLTAQESALPPYVSLSPATTDVFEYEKPHYAGPGHAPFRPFEESLEDLNPVKSLDQLSDRRTLLQSFDTLQRRLDMPNAFGGLDQFQAKALELIASPKVRDTFDLSREPEEILRKYGHKAGKYPHQAVTTILYDWDARPFVLARRLVEAGVRVVTLRAASWDHHGGPEQDIFAALKMLMRVVDQSVTALISDLKERGLEKDVMVVVLGEFGRTPMIEALGPGRGHWADAGCAMVYGGGLRMGQVIGETDSRAERSTNGKISFQNVLATIYRVLGVDASDKLPDFNGRPQYVLDDAQPIAELMA